MPLRNTSTTLSSWELEVQWQRSTWIGHGSPRRASPRSRWRSLSLAVRATAALWHIALDSLYARFEGFSPSLRQLNAIGHHPGAWVIELPLDGGVYCLIVNPSSEQQARQLANATRETPLIARHTDDEVWQLEGPEGVLLPYEALVQEVRASIPEHWQVQGGFLGIGFVLLAVGRVLQLRARQARLEQSSASTR
jgi:hypothetical protein